MNLDNELRAALQREPAPPDFAAKVLATARAPLPFPKAPTRTIGLALAAAIAALAIVPAVYFDYQRRQNERGMKAKQDLLIALSITRDRLQQTKQLIRRNTRNTQ